MTDLELINQLTENIALLTDKLTLAARAIDSLERRVDLFQAMLLHDPPHTHRPREPLPTLAQLPRPHGADAGDNLDGLLD